jgi:alkylated DNA nucleotide flippase Atl1
MNDDKAGKLKQILDYLNEVKTRTTYGVIAELLDVNPRSVGQLLGEKRPEASWVVNSKTKEPTDYSEAEKHADLYRTERVIESAEVFRRNLGI